MHRVLNIVNRLFLLYSSLKIIDLTLYDYSTISTILLLSPCKVNAEIPEEVEKVKGQPGQAEHQHNQDQNLKQQEIDKVARGYILRKKVPC